MGELYAVRYAELKNAIYFYPPRKDFPQSEN